MSYDNTNRGAIWGNKNKESDRHPDYTGTLNVEGVEYLVSAWKRKQGASDKSPALSFQIKPKEGKQHQKPGESVSAKEYESDFNDSIPF